MIYDLIFNWTRPPRHNKAIIVYNSDETFDLYPDTIQYNTIEYDTIYENVCTANSLLVIMQTSPMVLEEDAFLW